tara:strand:+ start:14617 stop:15210 length:594 start_codon:yes stop_codon:yes gene_type:complete
MSEETQNKRREARVNYFLSKGSNIFTENKLLKFAFVALFLMVMYQQISIPRAIESQRTIILPTPNISYEVGRFSANDDYLYDMALSLMHYYEDINAANVESYFSNVLMYAAPSFAGELRDKLNNRKKIIQKLSSISHFTEFVSRNDMTKKGDQIFILYNFYRRIGGRVEPVKRKRMTITFEIQNGLFQVHDIKDEEV